MTTLNYDAIADWYDESVRSNTLIHDIVEPALFALMGEISGLRICDLACGQGVTARQLAQRGAIVTGIDISEKLLAIARQDEEREPLGISYIHDDAQTLTKIADTTFDGVVCSTALMDIADIAAAFRQVYRVLRPDGWFLFAIVPPYIFPPHSYFHIDMQRDVSRVIKNYFNQGFWRSDNKNGVRGQIGSYHRTLSTYLNTLIDAGFVVERIAEPQGTGQIVQRVPGYAVVPASLVVKSRKRSNV